MNARPAASRRTRSVYALCAVALVVASFPAGARGESPRAVAVASDDFDGDGMPDLACGLAVAGGGFVTIARGNVDAVYGPESLSDGAAPPFLEAERVATVSFTPNLLAAGDFDNDGRRDLVAGQTGGDTLLLFPGDGHGALAAPHTRSLPGRLTALDAGDVNRIDGLADLVVGVDGPSGASLLVLEAPGGAWSATPEIVAIAEPAGAVEIGQFDAEPAVDIAARGDRAVTVVHGRNRALLRGTGVTPDPAPPVVEVREALAARAPGPRALSMRLNGDAVEDVVAVDGTAAEPSIRRSRVAAVYTVTTTADDGYGSLRDAITAANASEGADAIVFDIPGYGVRTIRPLSPLPDIVDPVTVDATTQPGYAGAPIVELDGSAAGEGVAGLHVLAGSSVVRGLVVNRFRRAEADVRFGDGVLLQDAGGNIVEGCYFGTDASGSVELPNESTGVYVYQSSGNLVGGTVAEARNLLSGSCDYAHVALDYDESVTGNRVEGNFIGTDVTGTFDLSSRGSGVAVNAGSNNVVGGTAPGATNVISGNGADFDGFDVTMQGERNNLVQGNLIGLDVTGTRAVATSLAGGVYLDGAAVDNTIGGTAAGAGNRIGFVYQGVTVGEYNGTSNGNAILGNGIIRTDALGIALGYDEATPNDLRDADSGPNDLQNFPVLVSVSGSTDTVTVAGRLVSAPSTTYRVELFSNQVYNRLAFGPGERFLGALAVTTDATGNADFETTLPVTVPAGHSITATATDPRGNTSEFSMCVGLELSWEAPDPATPDPLAPPRNLTVRVLTSNPPSSPVPAGAWAQGTGVTEYRVYRSNQSGVQPTPANFLRSVPPTQTSANANVFIGGTFFVVTAVYPNGESGPSNEVDTGRPPEVRSIKIGGSKVVGKGSGFTLDGVLVTVDGIPFLSRAAVKGSGAKVVQRGLLITGETVTAYARTRGGTVSVLFRNSTGGFDGRRVAVPGA
jgi:hypothetical protein